MDILKGKCDKRNRRYERMQKEVILLPGLENELEQAKKYGNKIGITDITIKKSDILNTWI